MIVLEHEITERFDYPSYTKNGYKKMKIPQDIYQLIQSLRYTLVAFVGILYLLKYNSKLVASSQDFPKIGFYKTYVQDTLYTW